MPFTIHAFRIKVHAIDTNNEGQGMKMVTITINTRMISFDRLPL
jgi:hypothetical protein